MIREEDREPTLLGSTNKHQRNVAREGVDVNGIGALLIEYLSECRRGFGIATAIQLLEHVLALRRHAIPPHAQAIMLIGLISAAAGRRRDKRFDPVSPQPMSQGFDIDLRAANWVRRKREWYMYYFQDKSLFVLGTHLRQSKECVKRVTLEARSSLVRWHCL